MNGVLNIFKNKGMTSFDVVSRVRKIANEKKVGHTGTLDPEAEGVLPVCIGKATKIIDYIMDSEKGYSVKFKLGIKTTTYDLEGEVIEERDTSSLTEKEVEEAINSFKGEYSQVPPMFSALKKNGVRLYDLARKGIEIEREGRNIKIYNIENINIELPYVSMDVTCSKGTYIRSLCYDIGEKLNVFATMTELKRFKTSFFREDDSINIDDLNKENIKENLISIEEALKNYPEIYLTKGYDKLIINGVRVADKRFTKSIVENDILYKVYDENKKFLGLGRKNEEGFKMEKLLIG
ncbi:MAG: tRNA pseudouridine(55) synthase TruB [Clostridium sp.]|nr:tRNA pseudouridine(55) synthase TruB [Clostridium sp.]